MRHRFKMAGRPFPVVALAVWLIGSVSLASAPTGASSPSMPYTDIAGLSARAQAAISAVSKAHLMGAIRVGQFAPTAIVTRGAAVCTYARLLHITPTQAGPSPFQDVKPGTACANLTLAANAVGLLKWFASGPDLSPEKPLTREQLAVLTVAAAGLTSNAAALRRVNLPYRDAAAVTPSDRGAVAVALQDHLIGPSSKADFGPAMAVRRVELAETLARLLPIVAAITPATVTLTASAAAFPVGRSQLLKAQVLSAAGAPLSEAQMARYQIAEFATRVAPIPPPAPPLAQAVSLSPPVRASGAPHKKTVHRRQGQSRPAQLVRGWFLSKVDGTYAVTASLTGGFLQAPIVSKAITLTAYGLPSQITVLGPSAAVADGFSTVNYEAVVEDSAGDVVGNFHGPVLTRSSDPAVAALIASSGAPASEPLSFLATGGIASFAVRMGTQAGSTVTLGASLGNGQETAFSLQAQAQHPTAIDLQAKSAVLQDKASAADTIQASVVDQAGYPMLAGAYPIALSLAGEPAAAFGPSSATTSTLNFEGGSSQPASITLVPNGHALGMVTITAASSGLPDVQTSVDVVPAVAPGGGPPTGGTTPSFLLTATGAAPTAEVPFPISLNFVENGTAAPPDGPVSVHIASTGSSSLTFTDLPVGSQLSAGGTAATLTLPAGQSGLTFAGVASAAGTYSVSATGTVAMPGGAAPVTVSGTLAGSVGTAAPEPMAATLTVSGQTAPLLDQATISSPGSPVSVTLSLTNPAGTAEPAATPVAVWLSDQPAASSPGGQAGASAGGAFTVSSSAPAMPVVAVPAGEASVALNYTNPKVGTYSLAASVIDLIDSGITAVTPGTVPNSSVYTLRLAILGGQVFTGDASSFLTITSTEAGVSAVNQSVAPIPGEAGLFTDTVTWSTTPPAPASLAASLSADGPNGLVSLLLGPGKPPPAPSELVVAGASRISIPADTGQAATSFYVIRPDGSGIASAAVKITLFNDPGSALSLSGTGSETSETVDTGATGAVPVTIYGHATYDAGTLTARLATKPLGPPTSVPVAVSTGMAGQLVQSLSQEGSSQFSADQGEEWLTFTVEDRAGNPLPNVRVYFSLAVGSNGLSLSLTTLRTDASGEVQVAVQGRSISDEGRVIAQVGGLAQPLSTETGPISVSPGAPSSIASSLPSGDAISADVAQGGFPIALAVLDAEGNVVAAGQSLSVSLTGFSHATISPNNILTGPTGLAEVSFRDQTATDSGDVVVTDPAMPGVRGSLSLTVVSGAPAAVNVASFSPLPWTAGQKVSLSLSATDAYGNPVNGIYPVTLSGSAVAASANGALAGGAIQDVSFQNGTAVNPIVFTPVTAGQALSLTIAVGPSAKASGTITTPIAISPALPLVAEVKAVSAAAGNTATPAVTQPVGPWSSEGALAQATSPMSGVLYTVTFQLVDPYGNPVQTSGVAIDLTLTPGTASSSSLSAATVQTAADGTASATYTAGATQSAAAVGDVLQTAIAGSQTSYRLQFAPIEAPSSAASGS